MSEFRFDGVYTVAYSYEHPTGTELIRPLGILVGDQFHHGFKTGSLEVLAKANPPWDNSDDQQRKYKLVITFVKEILGVWIEHQFVHKKTKAFKLQGAPEWHEVKATEDCETEMKMSPNMAIFVSAWLKFDTKAGNHVYLEENWEFYLVNGAFVGTVGHKGMEFTVNADESSIVLQPIYRGNKVVDLMNESSKFCFQDDSASTFSGNTKCKPFKKLSICVSHSLTPSHDRSGGKSEVTIEWNGNQFSQLSQVNAEVMKNHGWDVSNHAKCEELAWAWAVAVLRRFNQQGHIKLACQSAPYFENVDFPFSLARTIHREVDGGLILTAFEWPVAHSEEVEVKRHTVTFDKDGCVTGSSVDLFALLSRNRRTLLWLEGTATGHPERPPERNRTWSDF